MIGGLSHPSLAAISELKQGERLGVIVFISVHVVAELSGPICQLT